MPFQDNIANLIVPEIFNPYFMELTTEKTRVLAPMTSSDPAVYSNFAGGSRLVQLPFFKDLDGDDVGLGVGTEITTERITSGQDRARRHMRGKGWTTNDLESELSGEDPASAVAGRVASYWSRRMQDFLFYALDGVFADNVDNDSSDLVHDITAETGADAELSRTALAKAKNLIGDSGDTLTYIAMHSDTYTDLQIKDQIRMERDSDANLEFETFAGYQIIVDDEVPVEDGGSDPDSYTTYLFAPNSVAFETGFADVPSEIERDAAFSETKLFTRIHFMMHPRGFAWEESSVADETPTPAEVQDAANWDRVYDKKNVRIVKILHQSLETV